MARQFHHAPIPLNSSQTGLAAITLLFCGFALFLCASHWRKWRRWGACYRSSNHDPVIQLNTEAMMLSTGFSSKTDELIFSGEHRQEVPVWQKNILIGEKCLLPDFSGVIIYDSHGNIVTPARKPLPMLPRK